MADDTTATTADEPVAPIAPELSQAEQDALLQAQDGVDGHLVPNTPTEEPKNDDSGSATSDDKDTATDTDTGAEEGDADTGDATGGGATTEDTASTTAQPTTELAAEKDETGVYDPQILDDPGEFKPADYSFQVTTTDGKSHNIASLDEAEAFAANLDENPELISASQFMALNRKTAAMETGIRQDEQRYEAQKTEFANQQAVTEVRNQTVQEISSGFNFLEAEGAIPELKPEFNTEEAGAKWSTDYKDEPGVKERLEILQYMNTKNEKRMAAGLKPNFDPEAAYNAMQLEGIRQQSQSTATKDKEARQQRGSMVGGSSPHETSDVPAGVIIGPGGNIDDVLRDGWN